jgi:hypothetical protein
MTVLLRALTARMSSLRIEPRGRLVEKEHGRIIDERDCQQEALLLATRELAVVTVEQLLERAHLDHLVEVRAPGVQAVEQLQAFAHREKLLERRLLELDAGLFAKAHPGRLAAIAHFARRGRRDAFHDLDRGRLACAIRPQEAEAASFAYLERDAIHGLDRGVVLDELACLEDGWHGAMDGDEWPAKACDANRLPGAMPVAPGRLDEPG